jgi:hypothetical protein
LLRISSINYNDLVNSNLVVTSGNEIVLSLEMEPKPMNLEGVVVTGRRANVRAASLENPLSVQRLTSEDIKANPGGNFDISRVIQSILSSGGELQVKMYFI